MNQALTPGALIVTWKDFCLFTDLDLHSVKTVRKDHALSIVLSVDHEMIAILLDNGQCGWTVKITCMTTL